MEKTHTFADDFSTYQPGPVPFDYSPWGEYHCEPEIGKLGPWEEVTTHYSWRQSDGNWRVVPEKDRQVMEQTFGAERSYPMLIAASPDIESGAIGADVRILSFVAPPGIVFGYRHSRDFHAFLVDNTHATLIHRYNEEVDELGSADIQLDCDTYHNLTVEWDNGTIAASIDGKIAIQIEGAIIPPGRTGLTANAPARFTDFKLSGRIAPPPAPVRIDRPLPKPVLWKKIDISAFGTDRNLRIGDLNGDGENELLFAQRQQYLGSGDYCYISCLTATDLDGNILWQTGKPSPQGPTTADLCFQVHDIDGDGAAEAIYAKDFQLVIADGATGEIRQAIPTPATQPPEIPGGYPLARIIGDALYFCDLRGTGRADTILLKDRYKRTWAYDDQLRLLWEHACETGHYPTSYDIDGDGREELLMGYELINGEGKVVWSLDTFDHADSSVIGEFGPPGTGIVVALAGSDAGFFLLDAEGKQIVHYPMGHAQTISVAKLRPDVEGLQIVVNTYWGAPGITLILDHRGRILREFEPMHCASLLNPVNWPGDGTDLLLLSTDPEEGGLMDGWGERAVMFPNDGHPLLCCDSRDIDGDGVDEILTWDFNALWIYKPDPLPEVKPGTYPLRNPSCNDSSYRGQFSFPRQP
jgi:rhamnogalacturonan endolyase